MNSRYLTSLFCITILALAPACAKHQTKASSYAKATKDTSKGTTKTTQKEEINTMIEVDNDIFEIEEEIETKKSIRKF